MKFKLSYVIIVIIILIHLFVFTKLFISPEKREDKDVKKEEAKQEQNVGSENSGETLLPPEIQPPVVQPKVPAVVQIPNYSSAFFRQDTRELPKGLQAQVATLASYAVIDLDGRRVFSAKNASTPYPMASITKMMTTYLAVKKMRASNGAITLESPIKVSRAASQVKERRVWLSPTETFTFQEILKACLVHSANDCAYLLAEYCGGGNEQAFVAEMNKEAAAMGCKTLTYYNANGLPAAGGKENSGCALELAYLALHMMEYPEIMKWTGVKLDYLRENDEAFKKRNNGPTMLTSSNKLLGSCPGVNGMKTGYTNKAGHCIVATCERNNRRMAVVILGGTKERDRIASALFDWAYGL